MKAQAADWLTVPMAVQAIEVPRIPLRSAQRWVSAGSLPADYVRHVGAVRLIYLPALAALARRRVLPPVPPAW